MFQITGFYFALAFFGYKPSFTLMSYRAAIHVSFFAPTVTPKRVSLEHGYHTSISSSVPLYC